MQLLEKDTTKRLGTPECPAGDVSDQPFFRPIDWFALERRELEPPFKPRVVSQSGKFIVRLITVHSILLTLLRAQSCLIVD